MATELLTIAEAARELRMSEGALRSWRLQRRVLPFRCISGRVFVHRKDLDRLIEKSVQGPKK